MRRKSERNKTKGSPEKKVEKPTRKSTRRRGKRSTSSSSERDNVDDKISSKPCTEKSSNELTVQTRLHLKEFEIIKEEPEKVKRISPTEERVEEKSEEEGESKSLWKVARADASPGEIQKLKLCRQRNTSEAPDNSICGKRSNKWHESGGGDGEEVDSADEQLGSCKRIFSSNQLDDPSFSHPGQDSNEEVSDSKEILPKTTSANLSDDKSNIDQQGDSNEATCSDLNIDIKKSPIPSGTIAAPNSNEGDSIKEPIPKEETLMENLQVAGIKETKVDNTCKDSNSDEERDKTQHSDSSSYSLEGLNVKTGISSIRTPSHATRRKHRNKYHDSSDSDTPDSEDEPSEESKVKEEESIAEQSHIEKNHSSLPEHRLSSSITNITEMDTEQFEDSKQQLDNPYSKPERTIIQTSTQTLSQKSVKVNLKRSFSARALGDEGEINKEASNGLFDNESVNQNKENHVGDQIEIKGTPRKRRWGITLSVDVTPAFSVSTDSLKVLVPEAKPLPINEVRLTKDGYEERDRRKEWERRHIISDNIGEQKPKDDSVLQKNEAAKKGDTKLSDNHIATRRKISIVKEASHVKSPSPPAIKSTNIILIKNLVRPFTLNQIKELLSRTGTIVENGFWMDRIKSKCFVEYSNEDQAFETRQALHGISWPVSNPKRLHVEYATKNDMELARELSKDQLFPRKSEPLLPFDTWQQEWTREERINTTAKVTVVREWDLGKEDGQEFMKEKERDRKESDKKRRQRSHSPALEVHLTAPARKFKKKEDDPPPAKLLDDLFRKTKATPCIYWLPLTNEQIVVKEEMRRQHMAEHARRLEEMRRAERNRDSRHRRSPRK